MTISFNIISNYLSSLQLQTAPRSSLILFFIQVSSISYMYSSKTFYIHPFISTPFILTSFCMCNFLAYCFCCVPVFTRTYLLFFIPIFLLFFHSVPVLAAAPDMVISFFLQYLWIYISIPFITYYDRPSMQIFRYPTTLYILYLFPVIAFCIVFRMLIQYCSPFIYCHLFFLKLPVLAAAPDSPFTYLHAYLLLLLPGFLYFTGYLHFIRYLYFLISIKSFTIHHHAFS